MFLKSVCNSLSCGVSLPHTLLKLMDGLPKPTWALRSRYQRANETTTKMRPAAIKVETVIIIKITMLKVVTS